MKKRILSLLLCLTVLLSLSSFAFAADAAPVFWVDGEAVSDPGMEVCNQITYVSLYNVVPALRPDATVCWSDGQAVVAASGLNITARPGNQYIEANGRYLYVLYGVKVADGHVLVPVRSIAQAMDACVGWNAATGAVEIYKGNGTIPSGNSFYDTDAVCWLSHIINAESGNQPMDGKIAVGTVVLNRVSDPRFPDTIYGVIFQVNQFTPVSNGAIYNTPNEESIIAAKLCLEGVRICGSSLYFVNASVSPNSWAQRNRPYVATIGAHSFFA
ncbi:MAG: cell wall hydrolase [Intestinimonas sp.]|jgi:N-acetylmuramoyl-L-alanine amidase|nr:cell wall hydrolase [Intestinimonas sp.]